MLTDATLRGVMWLDEACVCLCDYRDPGYEISRQERLGLAQYFPLGFSPAAAAEGYQAATGGA